MLRVLDPGGARLLLLLLVVAACSPPPPPAHHPPSIHELAERLSGFIWPLPIERTPSLSSSYGARGNRHHDGLDIRARMGDPIYAASAGRVLFSGWRSGYGQTIVLDHRGGVTSLYAHASALYVAQGEVVARGQVIGAVGATGNATGPHLHFEIRWAGRPLDPVPLLPLLRRS